MITSNQISALLSYLRSLGALSLQLRKQGLVVTTKEDGSPVSNADKIINEKVANFVKDMFPTFGVISEELDNTWKDINWFVDPINGTKAYIKGKNENWNMLLGLVKENTPVFGIIYYPYSNKFQIGGTTMRPIEIGNDGSNHELQIFRNLKTKNMLLCPSGNWYTVWEKEFGNNSEYELIKSETLGLWEDPRISIAKNKVNLLLNKNWGAWGTWDIAAGHAILSAAGGVTADFLGNDIDYYSGETMLLSGFSSADSMGRIKKLPWYGMNKEEYVEKYEICGFSS